MSWALPWLAAASWIIYGVIHSLLAASKFKDMAAIRWPTFTPYYRIFYNLFAVALLFIPFSILMMDRRPPLWLWPAPLNWLADSAAIFALIGFIWSLKFYDLREFSGFLNPSKQNAFEVAKLQISPLHRYVRHPWYFFMLVIIWTREMNQTQLVSAFVITLYLIFGSRLEENKLIAQFGDGYRDYCSQVSGLIPLPWKILSRDEQSKMNQK